MTRPAGPIDDHSLLHELADGEFHSGNRLAARLGISRTAVWKRIHALSALGLDVTATPGHGYQLAGGLDLLDGESVLEIAGATARTRLEHSEFLGCTDSTNKRLTAGSPPAPGFAHLCMAEFQTAGRGRRGRTWVAPYASGLCLSLGWTFAAQPPEFSALSLVAGVAVCATLQQTGLDNPRLKWPNDIVCGSAKLGGVLIEIRGEADGPVYVVAGIGLNVRLPEAALRMLGEIAPLPATDLARCMEQPPERSAIAGLMIRNLIAAFDTFGREGFAPFAAKFKQLDAAAGRLVALHCGDDITEGMAAGVGHDGALLLDTNQGRKRFYGGEVSLRFG